MSEDLHTSESMINYTVAIFTATVGVAPLIWSPLSGFYGRKPVYLASMPIMTVASIGVAQSKTIGAIIGTRILQAIGSSAVLSVGAGTVGDIYRPTERANAMAWFYSGVLLGPALSPVLAGVFTQYTPETWKATQYFLCGASALAVFLTAMFLPETSHPPTPHEVAQKETGKRFVPYFFNPLISLKLMRYPNVVTTTIASSFVMLQLYCVMVPLAVIFKDRYNIHNVALSGCLYIAPGLGTLIGSRFVGPYADRVVRKWIEKRGYRRPEDRLRAALFGAGVIGPVSCLVYGWLLQANKGGLWPPLVMLAINGIGSQLTLTPVNTYLVDSNQKKSAMAISVNNFWRYLFAAASSAFVLPMIDAIGLGWTMTVAAAAQWIGFAAIFITMVYGEKWRESVNKSHETAEDKAEEAVDGGRTAGGDSEEDVAVQVEEEKARRSSAASHDHGEGEHGEPSHLPGFSNLNRKSTRTNQGGRLGRKKSRQGSSSTLPTVDNLLERTVSLSGASVHGGA